MEAFNFVDLVEKIGARVRELDPAPAREVRLEVREDAASWTCGHFQAALIFHRTEALPRLELMLHTGDQIHPETLEIGLFDADVVDMIAEPIAGLFSKRVR